MNAVSKSVWITRARPGAEATALRVRALGHQAIVTPLLAVRNLDGPAIDLAGVGALAFTSANGVRAFAAHSAERSLSVFAVGAGTAAAALDAGFADVQSADGDVAALAGLIARVRPSGIVLHPGARALAGDLGGALAGAGMTARMVALYETIAEAPPASFLYRIAGLDAVLVHSPKAGWRLAEILTARPAPRLVVFCLSPQVAETVSKAAAGRVETAAFPREDALLSLLQA